jgi:hypothetical protein
MLDASISRDADVSPTSVAVSTLAYTVIMNDFTFCICICVYRYILKQVYLHLYT